MATIKDIYSSVGSFTITLSSLANSSAGVGRQSTIIDNTSNAYLSAIISLSITVGTTPTANTPIYVYLVRDNNDGTPLRDDAAGASDAALTVKNAQLLGIITCPAATSDTAYQGVFDTAPLGPLGPKWGIAIVNNTGVALHATEGNHIKSYIGVTKSVA